MFICLVKVKLNLGNSMNHASVQKQFNAISKTVNFGLTTGISDLLNPMPLDLEDHGYSLGLFETEACSYQFGQGAEVLSTQIYEKSLHKAPFRQSQGKIRSYLPKYEESRVGK